MSYELLRRFTDIHIDYEGISTESYVLSTISYDVIPEQFMHNCSHGSLITVHTI